MSEMKRLFVWVEEDKGRTTKVANQRDNKMQLSDDVTTPPGHGLFTALQFRF